MQALNVKPISVSNLILKPHLISKPHLVNEIYEPSLNQKCDKTKLQDASNLSLQKTSNMKRLLEAYSDCV